MRMAMVEVIGNLIYEIAVTSDPANDDAEPEQDREQDAPPSSSTASASQTEKQLANLHALLLARTLDLSSYVRTRTFATLSRLLSPPSQTNTPTPAAAPQPHTRLPYPSPAQRLAITAAAHTALTDKAASVRRAAVGVLGALVCTHPYGIVHGGLMGLGEWEERYRGVKGELETAEKGVGFGEVGGESAEGMGGEGDEGQEGREDGMDVDSSAEEGDDEDGQDGGTDEEMPDSSPSKTPKKKSKKFKAKARPSLPALTLTDEQTALAALESNQLLHLRLRKRYYAEALNFIRMIEGAMCVIFPFPPSFPASPHRQLKLSPVNPRLFPSMNK